MTIAQARPRHIRLQDGRRLAFIEYGSPGGKPLVYFHGGGMSGLDGIVFASAAQARDVRLIALDRPGLGGSEPQHGRLLLDWPDDVLAAADALGIDRFPVLAISGGAPYALACAYKIPHRMSACGIVSGTGPAKLMIRAKPISFGLLYRTIRYLPAAYRLTVAAFYRVFRNEPVLRALLRGTNGGLAVADRRILAGAEQRAEFVRILLESTRQGVAGTLDEGLVAALPWGFELNEVAFERIVLWHGACDRIVPPSLARRMAQALCASDVRVVPGEGHYSLAIDRAGEILESVMSLAATAP